jgi:hypothetical protein
MRYDEYILMGIKGQYFRVRGGWNGLWIVVTGIKIGACAPSDSAANFLGG